MKTRERPPAVHRVVAIALCVIALFVTGCRGLRPNGQPTPAPSHWETTAQTIRDSASGRLTVRIRLTVTGTASMPSEVELAIAPPDGTFVPIGTYRLETDTLELAVDLTQRFGDELRSGSWRVRWIQPGSRDVLAETTFVVLQARTPDVLWQAIVPAQVVLPASCGADGPTVEVALRARNAPPNFTATLSATVTAPNGQRHSLAPVTVHDAQAATYRVALCDFDQQPARLVGTWTVRWFRTDGSNEAIAEARFSVALAPTPTPTPEPQLEWQLPPAPVQLATCDDRIEIRLRNATGSPDQRVSVVVRVGPPGQATRELATVTLAGTEWATVSLAPCAVLGSDQVAGEWRLEAIEPSSQRPLGAPVSITVQPLPTPTPTPQPPPQPRPQPPQPSPPPPPPPPSQVDTDRDGLSDDQERRIGTDPYNSDTDSDGLSDSAEVGTYGTNPLSPDTDVDGYWDGQEILQGSNPFDPCSPWQFAYNCQQP